MDALLDNPSHEEIYGRTIAGFRRRLAAFLIDILILSLLGSLLAFAFFDPLARIGDLGRGIGFIIALLYFGVQNSDIGGGQTIGKRLLRIKVVDASGNFIGLAKAHGRAAVLILPVFFNTLQLPFLRMANSTQMVFFVIQAVAVFGLGLGIVYLYLFNKETRQSLHDLIFGTFVVSRDADKAAPVGEVPWAHKAVVACLLAMSLAGPFFPGVSPGRGPGLTRLYEDLARTGKYTYIDVQNTQGMHGGTCLDIGVWLREEPGILEAEAEKVARLALADLPEPEARDVIVVRIGRGVDIGIATLLHTRKFHQSPMEWKNQLLMKSKPEWK